MNAPALPAPVAALVNYASAFDTQNAYGLKFESECLFAKQQLLKNDFTLKVAGQQPESLKSAILNVAAIGISLNPASAHAYLVPRSPAQGMQAQICLDLSYRGLVKLATDTGAITWAKAELVYEGDEFIWNGMTELPTHQFDPFDTDRMNPLKPLEKLRGGYCVAQLADGSYMVDRMTAAEITQVANTSKAKNGPWKNWGGEMAKKTLVKRASKSWPQSSGRERLDEAIQIINEHEGLALDDKGQVVESTPLADGLTDEQLAYLRARLEQAGTGEATFCKEAGITAIEELPEKRYAGAVRHIESRIAKQQGTAA